MCILRVLEKVSMKSLYRQNPRLLFLPMLSGHAASSTLLRSKEIEHTPDVLVVDVKPNQSSEKKWMFEFSTVDWTLGKTVLANCELEQCLLSTTNFYADKIKDLKGKELGLATFNYLPYALMEPLDGTEIRIAQEYGAIHNCTWRIVTDDEQWGQIYDNGTGNGILGAVVENRADVGLGALYLWYHEYKFLDFSIPYVRTGITCLAPRPHMLSKWLLPFRPFNSPTWCSVFFTLSVATVALYITNKAIRNIGNILVRKKTQDNRFNTLTNTLLHTFSLLLMQPSSNTIRTCMLVRFLLTSLQMMFLLIAASYSSGLASILTVPKFEKPVETVNDLYSSGLLWGATHDAWIFSLREAKEPYLKTLVGRFRALSKKQLLANAAEGNFAFSVERLPSGYFAVGNYITDKYVRKLLLMKEDIYWEQCIIVVRKGSPYMKSFNKLIHRLLDSGILLHWEGEVVRRFMPLQIQSAIADNNVMSSVSHEPTKIQISHVQGAFILLSFGLSISTIVFLMELYSQQVKRIRNKFYEHKHN